MKGLLGIFWTFCLFLIFLGCNPAKIDSEKYYFEDFKISNDTCKVVSFGSYFYTCYGEFRNPLELQNRYLIEKELIHLNSDNFKIDTLYRIVKGNSFIKYIYGHSPEEAALMQIVSARIIGSELSMTNGLKIGMSKSSALKMLFGKKYNANLRKVNNYQIITSLDGLWINLEFNKNRLSKISINSDYQVNQE